jgi:hypothetical protein
VKSITIIQKKDGRELQVIKPAENNIDCYLDSTGGRSFIVEDMNFDSNNDIRLITDLPGTGHNFSYYYWMYSPSSKKFIEDSLFSGLTEPEFYYDSKTIISQRYNGQEGQESETYELYKGRLRTIQTNSSEHNDYTGDYLESSHDYTYINGKQVETGETVETFDEGKKLIIKTTLKRINGQLKKVSETKQHAVKFKE